MESTKRLLPAMSVAAACVLLAACANEPFYGGQYPTSNNDGYYGSSSAGQYDQWGRVVDVRHINRGGGDSGGVVGTVAGGALGGLAGHQVGKGKGRTAATIAGAVGGALIGSAIERQGNYGSTNRSVYRVTVQLDNGGQRHFDYIDPPRIDIGERVRVEGDQLFR